MTATIVPPALTTEAVPARRATQPIPITRLVAVELRKMFNTRSGFWMLVSIGVLSPIATAAVVGVVAGRVIRSAGETEVRS